MPDLAARLGDVLGAEISGLERLAGGQSREMWGFTAGRDRLVLRREFSEGSLLEADGAIEFVLMRRLHELGIPVPEPILHHPDPELLGAPFGIMRRVAGTDLRKALADPGMMVDRRALGLELVAAQAALHAVDHRELGDAMPAVDKDPARAAVEHWARVIDANRADPEPLLVAALGWLRAHAPESTELCVVHGDFKANNLLFADGGLAAILDWEMAHIGDPVEDLAWTMLWDTEHDVVGGLLDVDEYVGAYERLSGRHVDPDALSFWWLFSLVKLAAIFQTGVRPGTSPRPALAMLGRALPVLEERIAAHLGEALARELV